MHTQNNRHTKTQAYPRQNWLRSRLSRVLQRHLPLLALLHTLPIFAQIIADPNAPGQQQPTVGITANGIPQIDIQTPNAAGLSHNQYQQFDVQAQGAILNNSREAVQTQLGGHITGNPHLIQSGPATTILNEVRSSDPSVLRGFMEVAGQKANVIVANPSGITCDGCGFINAHRSTLTTGTPQINNSGSLEAYRVTSGMINILGQGMLDPNVDYSAVLARAIQINAKIHANRLTAITGANHIPVDPNHPSQLGPPVPIAANPNPDKPLFALDVAELGSIYAKHIYLIGNEEGLGVRLDKGSAMEAGEFILTSAGEIVHRGSIKAQEEALLQAQQNITIDSGASIATQGDLSVSTAATLSNHGTLTSQNNLHLNANQTDNTQGIVHAEHNATLHNRAHLNNTDGQISAGDSLTLSTTPTPPSHSARRAATPAKTQTITNTAGKIHAGKQLTLKAAQLTNTAGQLTSTGDLNLALSGDYTHTGTLSANGTLSLSTDGTLTNQALLNALTKLSITAANLDNQALGEITAGSSLTLNISDTLNNRGLIDAASSLIHTQTLNNLGSGRLYSDILAISATTLNNDTDNSPDFISEAAREGQRGATRQYIQYGEETTSAADKVMRSKGSRAGVIAARQRLDLGIHTLNNRSHAQLLSLGDLAIGGNLDPNNQASGLADTINNHAATIDASGNLHLAANKLNNTNGGVTTENKIVASQTITEYLIDHETQRRRSDTFLPQGTVIPCNPSNGQGDRCGSPLAVGEIKTHPDKFGTRDYIKPLYLTPIPSAQTTPEYQPDAAIYTHLGLTPPADNASAEQKTQALLALHQAITDYNQSVQNDNRVTNGGHYYEYHYTVTTTQPVVTHSDPGLIRAGGNLTLSGSQLTNDKSHILAGGALTGDLANLHNIGLEGIATTTFDGTLRYLSKSRAGNPRASDYKPYTAASIKQTLSLPVYQVQSHANLTPDARPSIPTQPDIQQRTIQPNLTLPSASLYILNPKGPDTQPLIETDPRFTNRQQWLGSQALLNAGNPDPNITQKQLGDAYYQQQLIREQIAQLTGRRFLTGYQNDNDQNQALINNSLAVAQTLQLTPGIALTADQIAQLTTNIIWLVQQTITLPDGSTTQALVPQVYLNTQPGDPTGGSTLIAGDTVQLKLNNNLHNSGTLAANTSLNLNADNLHNRGHIQAADAILTAHTDIHNLGGTLSADNSLTLQAGQDIHIKSTTNSTTAQKNTASASRTHLNRIAALTVGRNHGDTTTAATSLIVQAGRDINLIASDITNHTSAASTFTAGRDLNLHTLQTQSSQTLSTHSQHHRHTETTQQSQDIGSTLNTLGNINLQAGQDITAKAANITSEQGANHLSAGRDITLKAGQQSHHFHAIQQSQSHGFLSSSRSTRIDSVTDTQALGTTISSNTVNATAGNNITLTGSNIVSDSETKLTATNNITVQNAQNTHRENHLIEEKKSGLMGSGGVGFTIGSLQQSKDAKQTETSNSASTIGATKGNINITAGKAYTQVGSDLIALNNDPKSNTGNIDITAQSIDISASQNTASQHVEEKTKQSGLTIAITSPVITAVQTAEQMRQAKNKTRSGRMKILADAATVAAAYNAGSAVAADPKNAGGVGISVSIGSSQSHSISTQTANTLTSSNLNAAGNLNLQATGAGENSNINIIASTLKAGQNINLQADNDINLLSGQNISEQHSTNQSSSASIGIGFSLGGTQNGFSINAGFSKGRGKADGQDINHTHTEVDAGQQLTIKSGRDTNLKGATATGKTIIADIGRDLTIESVQDKSTYHSEQKNMGAGVSICVPPICAGASSASVNLSKSNVNNNYLSVTQQSGFKAGDQGFQINVAGNTDLKAGLIASTEKAAADNKNTLTTATLTTSDLHNQANYEANSISVGMGTSAMAGALNPAGMGFGNDSDSQASTTRAGISQATINITSTEKQKALTGKDATQTVAELNRNVSTDKDSSGALQNKFDATRVQNEVDAQTQITQTFGQQAAQAIGTIAQNQAKKHKERANDLKEKAADQHNNLSHDERQALLAQAQTHSDEASKWDEGGRYRVAMHTVAGAMSGGVAGAASAATVAGSANPLGELQSQIQSALKNAGASESVANITSQIISQAAAAGLGGAVGTAAGGATGNTGTDAIAGIATGLNVDANNRQLTHPEHIEIAKLSQGDPEKTKRYAAAACAMTRCYAEYPENSEQYQQLKALADWGSSRELKAERKTLYEHPTLFNYTRHGLFSEKNIDALKQTNNTYQLTNRGLGAIQGILGTAAVAYVGSLCTNPLTCGLGVASLATNLDYANAGFNQMLNGQPQIPLGEQTLRNMGVDKDAAALIYMGIGLVPAFTASTAAQYVANLGRFTANEILPVTAKMAFPPGMVGGNSATTDITSIRAIVLNNITDSQAARASSNFGKFVQREGKIQEVFGIWPPNSGGYLSINSVTLPVRTPIDRYGFPGGNFVSPIGTPFTDRALPSAYQTSKPYFQYEVIKEIPDVTQAKILPWFGQRGMGTQYQLPNSVQWYLENGYLKAAGK